MRLLLAIAMLGGAALVVDVLPVVRANRTAVVVADHTSTDLAAIPAKWIRKAKQDCTSPTGTPPTGSSS